MITLDSFTQHEREHLICLLRSIDADALATVFDPRDAMIADNAKGKMIVLLEDAVLNVKPDAGCSDSPSVRIVVISLFSDSNRIQRGNQR